MFFKSFSFKYFILIISLTLKSVKSQILFIQGKGKLCVIGSHMIFSDQYIDKEENNKLQVINLYFLLIVFYKFL